MNHEEKRLQDRLQQSMPPTRGELQHDLWPKMLDRLGMPAAAAVPWFDWALLVAVILLLMLVPRSLPLLLYHL